MSSYSHEDDFEQHKECSVIILSGVLERYGRYFDALAVYGDNPRLDPSRAILINDQAVLYSFFGRYEGAESLHRFAVDSDPKNPVYLINHGKSLRHLQQFDEAYKKFQLAHDVAKEPLVKAIALYNLGQYNSALEIFKTCDDAHTNAIALLYRGKCHCAKGQFEEAYKLAKKAKRLRRYHLGTTRLIGHALFGMKKYGRCIRIYSEYRVFDKINARVESNFREAMSLLEHQRQQQEQPVSLTLHDYFLPPGVTDQQPDDADRLDPLSHFVPEFIKVFNCTDGHYAVPSNLREDFPKFFDLLYQVDKFLVSDNDSDGLAAWRAFLVKSQLSDVVFESVNRSLRHIGVNLDTVSEAEIEEFRLEDAALKLSLGDDSDDSDDEGGNDNDNDESDDLFSDWVRPPPMKLKAVVSSLFDIANSYFLGNEITRAMHLFDLCILAEPDKISYHFNAGNCRFSLGDYAKAAEHFSFVRNKNQSVHCVLRNRGDCYSMMDEFGKALADYETLLGLYPQDIDLEIRIVTVYERIGKLDDAMHLCRELVVRNPKSYDAKFTLASLCLAKHLTFEAKSLYLEILEKHPDDVGALCNMGVVLTNMGSFTEAFGYFEQALEKDNEPRDSNVLFNFASSLASYGDYWLRHGDIDKSITLLRRSLQVSPINEVRIRLANILFLTARYDEALTVFREVYEADPGNNEAKEKISILEVIASRGWKTIIRAA